MDIDPELLSALDGIPEEPAVTPGVDPDLLSALDGVPEAAAFTPIADAVTQRTASELRTATEEEAKADPLDALRGIVSAVDEVGDVDGPEAEHKLAAKLRLVTGVDAFGSIVGTVGAETRKAVGKRVNAALLALGGKPVGPKLRGELIRASWVTEMLGRSRLTEADRVASAGLAGRAFVDNALRPVLGALEAGQVPDAQREDYNQRLAAAAYLKQLTDNEWDVFTSRSRARESEAPISKEDADLLQVEAFGPGNTRIPGILTHHKMKEVTDALATVTGSRDVRNLYNAHYANVRRLYAQKNAGVLAEDPFKKGIYVESEGGLSPVELLSEQAVDEIATPDDRTLLQIAGGGPDEAAKVEQARLAARANAFGAMDHAMAALNAKAAEHAELRDPAHVAAGGWLSAALDNLGKIGGKLKQVYETPHNAFHASIETDAQRSLGNSLARMGGVPEEVAKDARNLIEGAKFAFAWYAYGAMGFADDPVKNTQRFLPPGQWTDEMKDMPDYVKRARFDTLTNLGDAIATHRQEAYEGEQVRQAAMMKNIDAHGPLLGGLLNAPTALRSFGFQAWEGALQTWKEVIDKPEYLPLFLGAEALSDRLMGGSRDALGNYFGTLFRSAHLRTGLRTLGRYSPETVSRVKGMLDRRLSKLRPGVDTDAAHEALTDAVAHTQTLVDEFKALGPDNKPSDLAVNRFAQTVARVLPSLGDDLGDVGEWILAKSNPEPSSFGWKQFRNWINDARGAVPQWKMNQEINRFLSGLHQDMTERLVKNASPTGAPDPLAEVLDIKRRIINAEDAAERDSLYKLLEQKMGSPGQPNTTTAKILKDVIELEDLEHRIKAASKNRKHPDAPRLEEMQKDALRIRAALAEPIEPGEMSMATLTILKDTRLLPTSKIGRAAQWINRFTGKNIFPAAAEMAKRLDMAADLHGWYTNFAQKFYVDRLMNASRMMRLDKVYTFARNKIRALRDETKLLVDGGRLMDADIDAAKGRLARLDNDLSALDAEHRRALSNPTDVKWSWNGQKIARHYVTDENLLELAEQDKLTWGIANIDYSKFFEKGALLPSERATLRGALKQRRELRRKIRELQKQVTGLMGTAGAAATGPIKPVIDLSVNDYTRSVDLGGGPPSGRAMSLEKLRTDLNVLSTGLRKSLAAVKAGESPPTQFYKALVRTNFEALRGRLPDDVFTEGLAFLDMLPEKYFTSRLAFRELPYDVTDPALGQFTPRKNNYASIDLTTRRDIANPMTIYHEWGHYFLHAVAHEDEVRRLLSIFRKEVPTQHPHTPDRPRPGALINNVVAFQQQAYVDHFTEWFANSFSKHVWEKRTADPNIAAIFDAIDQRVIKEVRALHAMDRARPQAAGMPDFYRDFWDEKLKTLGRDMSSITDLASREARLWFAQASQTYGDMLRAAAANQGATANNLLVAFVTQNEKLLTSDDVEAALVQLDHQSQLLDAYAARIRAGQHPQYADEFPQAAHPNAVQIASLQKEIADAVTAHDAAQDTALSTIENGARTRVMTPQGSSFLRRKLSHRAPDKELLDSLRTMQADEKVARAARLLGHGYDPLTMSALPYWEQVRATRMLRRLSASRIAIHANKLDALNKTVEAMSPDEQKLLSRGITAGRVDQRLLDRYPKLAHVVTLADGTLDEAKIRNLNAWLDEESAAQAAILELARDAGFIDEDLYGQMRARGYNPHLYGLFERPKMVRSKRLSRVKAAMKSGKDRPGMVEGVDGSELMFARDLAKFRVRVREADGKIYDKRFRHEHQARAWIEQTFGRDAMKKNGKPVPKVDGKQIGQTTAGDEIVLADPVGEDTAARFDLLTGKVRSVKKVVGGKEEHNYYVATNNPSPIARLESFARLNRDLHAYMMLESMRPTGMVIDARTALATFATKETGLQSRFLEQYRQLPDDRRKFGNLAGAFVHRRVLTQLNSFHHTYDGLRAWVDSLQEVFEAYGTSLPEELADRAPGALGRLDDALARGTKTAQIMATQSAWVANNLGNVIFSTLAGVNPFDAKNWPHMKAAIMEVLGQADRSQLHEEMVRNNILSGSLFERASNPHAREAMLRLSGLFKENKEALEGRLQQLNGMLLQQSAENKIGRYNRHMAAEASAIEEALQELSAPYVKRLARAFASLPGFMDSKNKLGQPRVKLIERLRNGYGMVDDVWKSFVYRVRRQVEPEEAAVWNVKTFMQDYAEVPEMVQRAGKSALGALVPSFGYEMGRITLNAIRHRPELFMSTFGAVGAFNALSAGVAGVNEERVMAMERSMGSKTPMEQMLHYFTHLKVYSPRTHDLIVDVDLGDTFIPLLNFVDTQNSFSKLIQDQILPPNVEPTAIRQLGVTAAKFAGNFVLGRPLLNSAMTLVRGRDPMTNKPLLSADPSDRTRWDYARALYKAMGQNLVPPMTPVIGRQWMMIEDAATAPIHPDSERPYGAMGLGQALIKATTNINVRGLPSYAISKMLGKEDASTAADDKTILRSLMWEVRGATGAGYSYEVPVFGRDADRKRLAMRFKRESDPAAKAMYEAELRKLMAEEETVVVGGRKATRSVDEYTMLRQIQAIEDRGVANYFADMNPWQQALVLREADRASVRTETLAELFQLSKISPTTHRLQTERNPYLVQEARSVVKDWIATGRADPAFREYYDYLMGAESRARRLMIRDKVRMGRSAP